MTTPTLVAPKKHYDITMIRDEARQLVEKGVVNCHQPIYVLCQYIPAREWMYVESELEKSDYLLRDQIGDLIPDICWDND